MFRVAGILLGGYVAMSGKESGVAVVGLLLLVAWYQRRLTRGVLLGVALLGLFAAGGIPTVLAINHGGDVHVPTAWQWVELQSTAVWRLIGLMVWPVGFSIEHDYQHVAEGWRWLAVGGMAGLAVLAMALARWSSPTFSDKLRHSQIDSAQRMRLVAFGLGWFLIALAPRFVVRVPLAILPERQVYVGFMGLAIAATAVMERGAIDRRRR